MCGELPSTIYSLESEPQERARLKFEADRYDGCGCLVQPQAKGGFVTRAEVSDFLTSGRIFGHLERSPDHVVFPKNDAAESMRAASLGTSRQRAAHLSGGPRLR